MIQFFGVGVIEEPAVILSEIIVTVVDDEIDVIVNEDLVILEIECE